MSVNEHIKKYILLATPVVVGQLGHIMVTVADSVMVGRVGVVPLAAATFAGTFYHILLLFGIGVSYSLTPLIASADPGDQSGLMRFLQSALLSNVVLGIVLSLIGYCASFFVNYFGQSPEVALASKDYIIIICSSIFPLMIFQTFRQFAEGLSDTLSPMIVSVVANLLNVVLNYIFIYGAIGFSAMGLNGAGYATLISRIVMAFMIVVIVRKKCIGFSWSFCVETIKRLLSVGIPSGMQYIFEVGAFAMAAIMVGWIGKEALAAHNIALNLAAISYMMATGIAAASTIRIGNQIRKKDRTGLRIAGFTGFGMVTAFMAFCGLIFILLRDFLPSLYIDNLEVKEIASRLLLLAAAFQISDGLQAVGLGVLRGLTDVKIPTIVTFLAFWLTSIPLGYYLAFENNYGVEGIWLALCVGLSIAACLHIWRFNRLSKNILLS